jgi:decaprenyl-phosphate phosphoribosyltransferase
MNKYLELVRVNEWYKNITVIIGFIFALILFDQNISYLNLIKIIIITGLACFVSSSNYIINAITDVNQDKKHILKKLRPLPRKIIDINQSKVLIQILIVVPLLISLLFFSIHTTLFLLALFIAAILYNVKPIRLKDIVYLDVISESINNPIRFLIGWSILTNDLPPAIILLLVWCAAGFLMTQKRIKEITDYPKSRNVFSDYSFNSLNTAKIIYFLLTLITLLFFILGVI